MKNNCWNCNIRIDDEILNKKFQAKEYSLEFEMYCPGCGFVLLVNVETVPNFIVWRPEGKETT